MSGNKICSSCKKNLDTNNFIVKNKIYKTCTNCRNRKSEKRRKNICETCGIRAKFNYKTESLGIRCDTHKEINMVDITRKRCEY